MLHRCLVAAVVVAGIVALAGATDGFRAVTAEGARRLRVERSPRTLPRVAMVDHRGEPFSWAEFEGSPVLVEFIFTTCPDICQKMSSDFRALVRKASEDGTAVRFVSVSFDPERDTVEQLARIAHYYGAEGELWRFARIEDSRELEETLQAFGVVAIPSPARGFEHNAAIHGVDERGRLARIADVTETEGMLRWARGDRY
jgi:protein SCO1/2